VRRARAAVVALACVAGGAACRRERAAQPAGAEARAELEVRRAYAGPDAVAGATFTWTAPTGVVFVLVAVESGVPGVVQARADLWVGGDSAPVRLGRSDVMSSAANIGAFVFEDVTGDGLPDLLGYVADSSGAAYPIFLAGARGMMPDQIEVAARGYRLSAEPEEAPHVYQGSHGACALVLWAEAPVPDGAPPGWRFLPLLASGGLGSVSAAAPDCP